MPRVRMLPMMCVACVTVYFMLNWFSRHSSIAVLKRGSDLTENTVRQHLYATLFQEELTNTSRYVPDSFTGHFGEDMKLFGKYSHGYNSTRIPALVYHNDVFIAFCEARKDTESDWGNIDIISRRGRRSGNKIRWEKPVIVASIPGYRVMNPTPIVDRERNTIVMVFISLDPLLWEKDIHENGVYNQTVQMTLSTDLGKTWAEPMDITSSTLGSIKPTAAMFAPGPGHGIQLRSGRLIVPGNVYIKDRRGHNNQFGCVDYSMVLYSDNGGQSWHNGGHVPFKTDSYGDYILTNEVQAVEMEDNVVCLNSRTLSPFQTRAISCSNDAGMHFNEPWLTDNLIEPGFKIINGSILRSNYSGCQASMVSFPAPPGSVIDEEHHNIWALFSNPADLGERNDLSIRLSTDSLKTWSFPWTIHTHAGAYSDMVFIGVTGTDSNAALHFAILYERGFRNAYHELAFRTFTLSDII